MYYHMKKAYENKPVKYSYETFGKQYFEKIRFEVHDQSHNTTKVKEIMCDSCEKTFANEEGLRSHTNCVHKEEDTMYYCTKCTKSFKNRRTMLNLKLKLKLNQRAGLH